MIRLEHNYSRGGDYRINITSAYSNNSDYDSLNLLFGAKATDIGVIKKNATLAFVEFSAKNTIGNTSLDWKWNCSNGVHSTVPFNMSALEGLLVVMEHNFTLSDGKNLTCTINSTDGNQSKILSFNFDGIKIEGYNSTLLDRDTVQIKFQIRNYYSTLNNVRWNVTADSLLYNASGITLNQGQTTTISQEINFTNAGAKQIVITIGADNFTDIYPENVKLYALGIQDFINYIKNGTTRVFNFIVKNDWNGLKTLWNISNPSLEHSINLTSDESLIVVIEENYAQGKKGITVTAFNDTYFEDKEIDVFVIKHVGINKFETLYENKSRAVTSSFVINNINPLNLSWRLDNSEYNISSNQNLELNASEQVFVIVENNFSSSGIYPLNFVINSSTFNDNQTGVAVS